MSSLFFLTLLGVITQLIFPVLGTAAVATADTHRVAVVTGAARGIGREILLDLVRHGVVGAACVDISAENCEETIRMAAEVAQTFGNDTVKLAGYGADVSDWDSVNRLSQKIESEFGHVDILVNNAGITRDSLLMKMTDADWHAVIQTNLNSMFFLAKVFVPKMAKQHWGRLINISSIVGVRGNAGQTNYGASKAGAIGFTKALAKEVAFRGVTVNAVAPGFIATPMTDNLKNAAMNIALSRNPARRFGTAQEVASTVTYLASEVSSYVTGTVFGVDASQII